MTLLKSNQKYFYLLAFVIALLVVIEYNVPKPMNWAKTLSKKDKIPYGTYILFEEIKSLFPNQIIRENYQTIYELHRQNIEKYITSSNVNQIKNLTKSQNYIFIDNEFNLDDLETRSLFDLAENGNHIFITAHYFGGAFGDSLNIETNYFYDYTDFEDKKTDKKNADSLIINFINPNLKSTQGYIYPKNIVAASFKNLTDIKNERVTKITILGKNAQEIPNFLKLDIGSGAIYLHTVPLAFSNYYMVHQKNSEYISKTLSYLPQQTVIWDEYYKVGRAESKSALRFILSNPPLRWAWYLFVFGSTIFLIFTAKRRQKMIPIVRPPHNVSLEFARTIGFLYFQHQDHKNLAEKQIIYFLERIREKYYIETYLIDEAFLQKLSAKTNKEMTEIKAVFETIQDIRASSTISESKLQKFYQQLHSFEKSLS